jgi:hypothetical protein
LSSEFGSFREKKGKPDYDKITNKGRGKGKRVLILLSFKLVEKGVNFPQFFPPYFPPLI